MWEEWNCNNASGVHPGQNYFAYFRGDDEYADDKTPDPQIYSFRQRFWIERRRKAERSRRSVKEISDDVELEKVKKESEKLLPTDLQPPEWSGAFKEVEETSGEGTATDAAGEHPRDSPAASAATSASVGVMH